MSIKVPRFDEDAPVVEHAVQPQAKPTRLRSLKPGQNPREHLKNYSGRHKFTYTYADLATSLGMTEGALRQQVHVGKIRPVVFQSVLDAYLRSQLLTRFRILRTRADLGLREFQALSTDEQFSELAKVSAHA
jgi:hypothetical protein